MSLTLLLMGCTKVIEKPVLIEPSEYLVQNCNVSEPLSDVEFKLRLLEYKEMGITSDWEAAFLIQTQQWFEQTNNLALCNVRLNNLREWYTLRKGNIHENSRGDFDQSGK